MQGRFKHRQLWTNPLEAANGGREGGIQKDEKKGVDTNRI